MNPVYNEVESLENAPKTDQISNFLFETQGKHESSIVFVLLLLGVVGLYHIPMTAFEQQEDLNVSALLYEHSQQAKAVEPRASQAVTGSKKDLLKISEKQLSVDGHFQAGTPLFFKINNFNKNASYVLRLNGTKEIPVDKKQFRHIFSQSGVYQIQLEVNYQEETAILHRETIRIQEEWLVSK